MMMGKKRKMKHSTGWPRKFSMVSRLENLIWRLLINRSLISIVSRMRSQICTQSRTSDG
jgi:hypothetical protein